MRYNRLDVAETLIRVKSIAEFILKTYIVGHWPTLIIEKDDKPYLNAEDNLSFIYKYKLLLEKKTEFGCFKDSRSTCVYRYTYSIRT